MHVVDGHIRDANMNYVCAAGTGSFVEEQALKLGYKVSEAGPAVLGLQPPRATDRCTVFMEQDLAQLIRTGSTPQEAFAAVMVSVVKNYLNKVVGNRYRSRDKIFFQGATARNPALVAAFERLLGRRDGRLAVLPRDGRVRRGAAHAPRDAGAGAGCQRASAASTSTSARSRSRRRRASCARTTARSRYATSTAKRGRRGATCAAASRASGRCA